MLTRENSFPRLCPSGALSEKRGPNKEVSSCSDSEEHGIFEPASLPSSWKMRFYDELAEMPGEVDVERFSIPEAYRMERHGQSCRKSEFRFIVLHLNAGTSGTTWILRWLPEVLGKYFCKLTFEIFVCDSQTRWTRAAAAGVSGLRAMGVVRGGEFAKF